MSYRLFSKNVLFVTNKIKNNKLTNVNDIHTFGIKRLTRFLKIFDPLVIMDL